VPIRDPKTLLTLKGIEAGDIGPKHGFSIKDNGYAIFNNFRIPRRSMLMKYHTVSKEGVYSLQGNEKISYATMLLTRAGIITTMYKSAVKMVTIATRYSIARTQFKDKNGQEISVLNYQTQQEKVIPRIAEAFAFRFIDETVIQLGNFVF
jgi:acyl-CoA oxidase